MSPNSIITTLHVCDGIEGLLLSRSAFMGRAKLQNCKKKGGGASAAERQQISLIMENQVHVVSLLVKSEQHGYQSMRGKCIYMYLDRAILQHPNRIRTLFTNCSEFLYPLAFFAPSILLSPSPSILLRLSLSTLPKQKCRVAGSRDCCPSWTKSSDE